MSGTTTPPTNAFSKARVSPGLFTPARLRNWLEAAVDLIFPPRCAGCGRLDAWWCEQCQHDLDLTPFPARVRPLPPLAGITSTGVHQGVIREAVQGLKYNNARLLAQPLGQRLMKQLQAQDWTIDMIVPVPLHTSRLAERGYNQAHLLGEQVAHEASLPCSPSALYRQRYTQSQVTLNADERRINMQDAFQADPLLVREKNILLVDDVYTTGATLSACAEAALAAGAAAVYGLTVTVARI